MVSGNPARVVVTGAGDSNYDGIYEAHEVQLGAHLDGAPCYRKADLLDGNLGRWLYYSEDRRCWYLGLDPCQHGRPVYKANCEASKPPPAGFSPINEGKAPGPVVLLGGNEGLLRATPRAVRVTGANLPGNDFDGLYVEHFDFQKNTAILKGEVIAYRRIDGARLLYRHLSKDTSKTPTWCAAPPYPHAALAAAVPAPSESWVSAVPKPMRVPWRAAHVRPAGPRALVTSFPPCHPRLAGS